MPQDTPPPSFSFNPSVSPGYGWVTPRTPSPRLRVLLLFVDAMEQGSFSDIMPLFDDSLQHWTLPASLGRPVLNKRQYGEWLKGVRPMFRSIKITINEVIEATNKLHVHALAQGESVKGTPFANECNITFHFIPRSPTDGADALPKICMVKEFIDSAANNSFFFTESRKPKDIDRTRQRPDL